MPSLGKKILGAFVDLGDDSSEGVQPEPTPAAKTENTVSYNTAAIGPSDKFKQYFETLLKDSNMPGPDYYEFIKMVEAMHSITDEKIKYTTAFTGLSIQGLDKKKLLDSAAGYLQLLEKDAANFHSTVDNALQDKVIARKKEMTGISQRIQELTKEINDLTGKLELMKNEVKDNEAKINASSGSYAFELDNIKNTIRQDIQKINQYVL